MSTTLTIRNLDESVKQKLRVAGASQGRSMEAQAREVLTRFATQPANDGAPAKNKGKFDSVVGLWQGGLSTDEVMQLTRGE